MNGIITSASLTMSSQEMADLVEKRHDNVKRTIESLVDQGVIASPQVEGKPSTGGRPATVYVFSGERGKRDSIIVVAQLSPEFTARLVDRWQELERSTSFAQLPDFTNPAAAARAWAEQVEQRQQLAHERDEAIRTKALIGSKREASAMAAAAVAKREADRLRHELGRNQHHATIIAVEQVAGRKFARNAYVALRAWCKAKGVSPVEVVDERYGMVKAWPAGAWEAVFDIDLSVLFGGGPSEPSARRIRRGA